MTVDQNSGFAGFVYMPQMAQPQMVQPQMAQPQMAQPQMHHQDHQGNVFPLTMPELIHAVSTLVQDQVKPSIGVLRRRVEELSNRRIECSEIEALVKSDVYGISGLRLEGSKGSLAVEINTVPPPYYVDPMDPTDPYPAIIWAALNCEVGRATIIERSWSGGRYGCAVSLKEELGELQLYSLGQVQHLVQLAIKKKILGYQGGALAPYVFSNEAKKKMAKSKTATSEMSEESDEHCYTPETPPRQVKSRQTSRSNTPPTPPKPPMPSPDDAAKFDELLASKLGVYQPQPACTGAVYECTEGEKFTGDCEEEPELPVKQRMVNFDELEIKEGVKLEVKGTFLNLRDAAGKPSRRVRSTPDEIVLASDRSAAQEASNLFQNNA
jgi:hypothetical protein